MHSTPSRWRTSTTPWGSSVDTVKEQLSGAGQASSSVQQTHVTSFSSKSSSSMHAGPATALQTDGGAPARMHMQARRQACQPVAAGALCNKGGSPMRRHSSGTCTAHTWR